MSQPAVSRSLAKLRNTFGDPLFLKGAKEMAPTARAQVLAAPLADVLSTLEAFFEPPKFDPRTTERVVTLATTDYGALTVVPPLMSALLRLAPGLRIDVAPVSADVFRKLADGEIDLMLYTDNPVPENCRTMDLFAEDYACVVRRDHPLLRNGKSRAIKIEHYLAWPHALITVFGGRKGLVDDALERDGKERNIALWMPYFSSMSASIENSDMILTLPRRAAEAFAKFKTLVVLEAPVAIEPFTYRLVWHLRSEEDPALAWLRKKTAEVCQSIDGR